MAQIVSKSQTMFLLCTRIFKWGANCLYKLISMRRGQKSKCSWPHLILISLYKQLAPHLKIGVHNSNTVCDFDTIWAVAAAIIVQLDTSSISSTLGATDINNSSEYYYQPSLLMNAFVTEI